ncbi:glycoside hydrolase family 47 protein [Cercospora zeae-maydis SCOH1-5]|uniref:alpha-1,2-Mannosidase n=1 Tax=Cercospora zeae-maydis SCOH1-5 TaxID=717836 RepID=A0A6A6FRE2_9PEZI|nr:glycoside hydrolase family 47 protein [Cercospora zeae-maydis SCOH1-5]
MGLTDIVNDMLDFISGVDFTTTQFGCLWSRFDPQGNTASKKLQNDAAALRSAAARGWFIPNGLKNWSSRPESLESVFYAYRITGDQKWADANWQILQAINTTARTRSKPSLHVVHNVDMPSGGSTSNNLGRFFFAEVLKYLYLTFVDASVVDLSAWAFHTEARP